MVVFLLMPQVAALLLSFPTALSILFQPLVVLSTTKKYRTNLASAISTIKLISLCTWVSCCNCSSLLRLAHLQVSCLVIQSWAAAFLKFSKFFLVILAYH